MKKENKKKVVTLSAMAALLAVVLGMGGKTYAKYFTESNVPAQTATVAKWGFVTNAVATNLFPGSDVADRTVVTTENGDVIVRADGTNVVHPGTTGSITFGVEGKAEVAATITFDVISDYSEVQLKTGSTIVDSPMKWTLKNGGADVAGCVSTDLKTVVDYLEGLTGNVAVNTDPEYAFELSWVWAYERGADDIEKAKYNGYDTALGLIADGKTSDPRVATPGYTANLDVKFGITIKVEQAA